MNNTTTAIVPGSFDPITNGHIFIIQEAAKRYKKIYVAVMINAEKKYTFTLEERKQIALAALHNIPNVEVISSDGWLYELANTLNADAIVKGYRNEVDLEYERKMAEFNRQYAPNTETVLIKSTFELTSVSSTMVREKIKNKNDITELLPQSAIDVIEEILRKREQ
jgi:pantetheine-phosphate adenylyltransferase